MTESEGATAESTHGYLGITHLTRGGVCENIGLVGDVCGSVINGVNIGTEGF